MNINTLGAIAGGIRQGRDNTRQRQLQEEERDYIKKQREFQQGQQDRTTRQQQEQDALKANMASARKESAAGADEGGASYAMPGTGVSFGTKDQAEAYRASVDSMASNVAGGMSPMARGVKAPAAPAMNPGKTAELPAAPKVDLQEIVRPKKTGDALFYHGPWQSKLRAEYEAVHGPEAAMAMDEKLKGAADRGYKQRVLEAAELQKAGDMKGAALKLNEIYNRDYVDGAFSNVRFIGNDTVEVVRFLPDGRIVDRYEQPMPDMVTQARQLLTPEQRAELLVSGLSKNKPLTMVDQATGEAVLVDPTDPTKQQRLPGVAPAPAFGTMVREDIARDQMAQRERENAIDNARADRTAATSGRMTEAQKQAQKLRDAKIKQARAEMKDFAAKRAKQGLPATVPQGHPMAKTQDMAKEPLSSEVE